MTLITLLIALTIERISATSDIWQFPFYYQKYKAIVSKRLSDFSWLGDSIGPWAMMLIPVLMVLFLSNAIDWLLIEFVFNLGVLLVCIGCIKQRKLYKSFLNATKRGDDSAAEIYKGQLCGYIQATSANDSSDCAEDSSPETSPESSSVKRANADKASVDVGSVEEQSVAEAPVEDAIPTSVNDQITDAVEDTDTVETEEASVESNPESRAESSAEPCAETCGLGQSIVWLNFRYYCAILFWFVVAGPTGAVAYCMVREVADDQDEKLRKVLPQDQVKKVLHWLDWIPARVCSAGYLLIGNFTRAASVWVGYLLDFTSPAKALVTDIAEAAEMVERDNKGRADEAVCMLKLAKRNVLFFLGLVALLTIYGGVR